MFGSQASEGETIMNNAKKHCLMTLLVVAASWLAGPRVHADVVTDWSSTAGEIAVAGKLPPGGAYRTVAVVQTAGIAGGDRAATAIVAVCAGDGFDTPESYRPHTTPGVYVPTVLPDIAHWPGRKPWLLASADQFRPGPPPSLTSAVWARDYNEIKALGAKQSTQRTAEQTAIARFWEARVPTIYLPVVLSVATAPGREPTQNARLLAVATQAM